ncbi:hypothetical protein BGZ63DRAFT_374809 [Mariannaea sp. PMI_226]|nr:hypothetical protein BGZ63DRAFT_374809 [Mariannaea sp. PMI_226]
MASQLPAASLPSGAAANTIRNSPKIGEKKTETKKTGLNRKPKKRNVLRPNEIVPPEETQKQKQQENGDEYEDDSEYYSEQNDDADVEEIQYSVQDEYDEDDECDEYDEYDEYDDEDDDDDDDIESIYLSDSEPKETTSKAGNKTSPQTARSVSSRQYHAPVPQHPQSNALQPRSTTVETRTQSSQWFVVQQPFGGGATVTRGASASRQHITRQQLHSPNTTGQQERGVTRGSGFRLNMSFNLNVNFSGLVSGRDTSAAGGSLSYAWTRHHQS